MQHKSFCLFLKAVKKKRYTFLEQMQQLEVLNNIFLIDLCHLQFTLVKSCYRLSGSTEHRMGIYSKS